MGDVASVEQVHVGISSVRSFHELFGTLDSRSASPFDGIFRAAGDGAKTPACSKLLEVLAGKFVAVIS